jgi:outer membrane protein TolC
MGCILFAGIMVFARLSLAQAESAALAHSPDIVIARSRVAEAQALLAQARATFGPALTANYSASPQAGPANTGTVTQQMTSVGAQWTLGDLLAYAPAVAQADAQLQAARLALADAERTQTIALIATYYGALQSQATLRARDAELAGADAELRAARLRYSAGDAPRLDVVRASVAVAAAQADLARARADAQDADAALEQATGSADGALRDLAPSNGQADGCTGCSAHDASALIALALAQRPDVAAARANVTAAQHAVAAAKRGLWPLMTVSGGYTRGVDTGIPVSGPNASIDVTVPVTGAAHDRVLVQQARLAQAQAELDKIERSVTLEVGSALRARRAQTAALAASQRALHDARAEFVAAQLGYRSGAVSSLSVESARATYVQALVAHIAALYAQARARATLALVIGESHA